MTIYNVHTHTFTVKNVPNRFLPLGLNYLLKPALIRKPLSWIFRKLIPFTNRDFLERYVNFLKISSNKTQEDVFKVLRGYYPRGNDQTRFIVLPMDMRYMRAGKVPQSMDEQHEDLARLRDRYPDQVIPFVAVDPRSAEDPKSRDPLETAERYVNEYDFKGIKIYPPLGYYPSDERLYPVYKFAKGKNLPVMSHCSPGGVFKKKVTKDMLTGHPWRKGKLEKTKPKVFTDYYTEPENYRKVLTDFPELKMCLAHFGGNTQWDKYLYESWDPGNEKQEKSWLSTILDLMKVYPNLYTDISSTLFKTEDYFSLLKVLMQDAHYQKRILFGSDFYMVERDKVRERSMAINIRASLGERLFGQMAEKNPAEYLTGVPQPAAATITE